MKNVIKKMFSLLLVGVVAVSMFGVIAPNRVNAAETNANLGKVRLETVPNPKFDRHHRLIFSVEFLNKSGKPIGERAESDLNIHDGESREVEIPSKTKSIMIYKTYRDRNTILMGWYKFANNGSYIIPSADSIIISASFSDTTPSLKFNPCATNGWCLSDQDDEYRPWQ